MTWTPARRPGAAQWVPALLALAVLALALTACKPGRSVSDVFPEPIQPATTCAVDGMLLMNHPGPKGQIVFNDGTRAFTCDVREVFEALYDPEQAHRIAKAFAQPFDGRDWAVPYKDGWAEVHGLFYVLGSRQMGHMGPTLVPFRERGAAQAFVAQQGGRLLEGSALTAETVSAYVREARAALRGMNMQASGGHGHAPPPPQH